MAETTYIKGKDRDLESSIEIMFNKLKALGIEIEQTSWLNPVPNVYSVHIRDKACGLMFTNGKGASHKACLASALAAKSTFWGVVRVVRRSPVMGSS